MSSCMLIAPPSMWKCCKRFQPLNTEPSSATVPAQAMGTGC